MPGSTGQRTTAIAAVGAFVTQLTSPTDKILKLKNIRVNNRSGAVLDLRAQNAGIDSEGNAITEIIGRWQFAAATTTIVDFDDEDEVWDTLQFNPDVQPFDLTIEYEEWPGAPQPLDE